MGLVAAGTVDDVVVTEKQKQLCAESKGKDYSSIYCNGKIKCCKVGGCERYRGANNTVLAICGYSDEKVSCTKPTT